MLKNNNLFESPGNPWLVNCIKSDKHIRIPSKWSSIKVKTETCIYILLLGSKLDPSEPHEETSKK